VAARRVKLLHVEDGRLQHRLVMHRLKCLDEIDFVPTWVVSQDAALEAFKKERHDLVILDYELSQGNGLDCLREIRALDPVVPIVAFSGAADHEIASELVKAGADDFLSKLDFDQNAFRSSIQSTLQRAELMRQRRESRPSKDLSRLEDLLLALSESFLDAYHPSRLELLDDFETTAQRAKLSIGQLDALMSKLVASSRFSPLGDLDQRRIILRPLVLELAARIEMT
jgi:DNA-binding response OmpR family regulator